MHTVKIISKDETLSLLNNCHILKSSVRALEDNMAQDIQTLQKAVVKRHETIEKCIEIDEHRQKVQEQDLVSSVHTRP